MRVRVTTADEGACDALGRAGRRRHLDGEQFGGRERQVVALLVSRHVPVGAHRDIRIIMYMYT
jgi:hypothetical protein